ncbi:H-NS family nucleoid-associated regulatory protein [Paraburkholderia domus]|uniref:DNA-binding protein Bv3F n=1 Tax=Paraburkholderia domus TaxID=2793075 RepID=A0A9N8MLF3_9BURK|nr:H-NS histone family protein [Paraburkholderia domus]MBK5164816.1 H-NS histone family protein [Burkholderia sp. R-70211]CAE6872414.1 DNA-binding protein Bv3F [Paraburkholderia domus]
MTTYKELLAQKAKLDAQLEQMRSEERAGVIEEIRQKMSDYQITLDDIGGKAIGRKAKGSRSPVEPKYRDPLTGQEWVGRGRAPNWIKEAPNRDKFLIK